VDDGRCPALREPSNLGAPGLDLSPLRLCLDHGSEIIHMPD
jgi:hypothetical protein